MRRRRCESCRNYEPHDLEGKSAETVKRLNGKGLCRWGLPHAVVVLRSAYEEIVSGWPEVRGEIDWCRTGFELKPKKVCANCRYWHMKRRNTICTFYDRQEGMPDSWPNAGRWETCPVFLEDPHLSDD